MKVTDDYKHTNEHSIEWGNATWDISDFSVRNRYDNAKNGKFYRAGSGEIPWEEFKLMIKQSILKKQFTKAEMADILADTAKSI
jgi:hypothetical protein